MPEINKVILANEGQRVLSNDHDENRHATNYQHYERKADTHTNINGKKIIKKKKRADLDMISSIQMPDTMIMSPHETRPVQTLQNNLINS